ncbi:hypothetical protein Tsp_04242 [Trichinella spiralis]|uniref:hypothetical protein n=1 Tax=Trichinella spiralis TaxID=6334 RepID=UPI0001EFBF0A|nr:hypothetical protein Tsp_04242 [Trichinella spiralis]
MDYTFAIKELLCHYRSNPVLLEVHINVTMNLRHPMEMLWIPCRCHSFGIVAFPACIYLAWHMEMTIETLKLTGIQSLYIAITVFLRIRIRSKQTSYIKKFVWKDFLMTALNYVIRFVVPITQINRDQANMFYSTKVNGILGTKCTRSVVLMPILEILDFISTLERGYALGILLHIICPQGPQALPEAMPQGGVTSGDFSSVQADPV